MGESQHNKLIWSKNIISKLDKKTKIQDCENGFNENYNHMKHWEWHNQIKNGEA